MFYLFTAFATTVQKTASGCSGWPEISLRKLQTSRNMYRNRDETSRRWRRNLHRSVARDRRESREAQGSRCQEGRGRSGGPETSEEGAFSGAALRALRRFGSDFEGADSGSSGGGIGSTSITSSFSPGRRIVARSFIWSASRKSPLSSARSHDPQPSVIKIHPPVSRRGASAGPTGCSRRPSDSC